MKNPELYGLQVEPWQTNEHCQQVQRQFLAHLKTLVDYADVVFAAHDEACGEDHTCSCYVCQAISGHLFNLELLDAGVHGETLMEPLKDAASELELLDAEPEPDPVVEPVPAPSVVKAPTCRGYEFL